MTLELVGVEKRYGDFRVGPLDLVVADEVLAVLGPSGGGKTTLLSLIAGIVEPDGGRIALDGRPLVGRPLEARRVGMVFQDGALFPHMSARENVAYAATDRARVDELAALLEIDDVLARRPAELSGGERQRVALARTLAADPDLLLLDEPLSSLDTPIRRRLRDELHDLFRSLAIPVVYVTHDQRAATVLGDRLAVLHDGSVEQVDTPRAVLNRPASGFVARFTGTENVFPATVAERDGAWATLDVGGVSLRTRTDEPVGRRVTCCLRPSHVGLSPADSPVASENTLTGRVRRRLDEGDDQRFVVALDDVALELTASVRANAVAGSETPEGSAVRLSVPPESIHVIPA